MSRIDDQLRATLEWCAQGRYDEAAAALTAIIARMPRQAEAHRQLGLIDFQAGRVPQALAHLEIAAREAPARGDIKFVLGFLLMHSGNTERGRGILSVIGLDTRSAAGSIALADLASQLGDPAFAEKMCRAALTADPASADALARCGSAMFRTGRADDAVAFYSQWLAQRPGNETILRAMANTMAYAPGTTAAAMRQAVSSLGAMVAAAAPPMPPAPNDLDPERPLRIAYLAQDLNINSAIARFLEAAITHRDKSQFQITGYCVEPTLNRMSPRLKAAADRWLDCTQMPDDRLAATIRADKIDILVDLIGQTPGCRPGVLTRRPAPLQGTFIGDAKSTGLPGVNFKFVDAITDPPGAEEAYTERLVRLEGCFLCYRPSDEMPEPTMPAGPGITFGSFNVPEKVGPDVVALWARVLAAVPGSTLVLKASSYGPEWTRRIYRDRFTAAGIAPERVRMLPHTLIVREHYAQYHRIDVALDPFPYTGTTTSCDALWMGVPLVTLRGTLHAGRVGASLLTAVGLPDLIAENQEHYIAITAALAADRPRREQLRQSLRATCLASDIGDAKRYGAKIDQAYRTLWRERCAGTPLGTPPLRGGCSALGTPTLRDGSSLPSDPR